MGLGFSPLDEALGLGGGAYSPRVLRWLARLGATLPFAQAAELLAELTGVCVSPATVRRQTEALGATAVACAEADVQRIEREPPTAPASPERLVLSVDGAMVPLCGGIWAEVKQLCVGEPAVPSPAAAGRSPPRSTRLSYFARLCDGPTFERAALGELQRRGLEHAGAVAAVQDGAPWLQGFVDYHRADALRILDWAHAAQRLSAVSETVFGPGTPRSRRAADRLRTWLWQEGPARVLAVLARWQTHVPAIAGDVAYLRERQAHLAYPAFRAAGWPVGSGAVESAHKTVMQARMKRSGMHWDAAQVNPLLALRLLECNRRWPREGPALVQTHQARGLAQRRQRQHTRRAARHPQPASLPAVPPVTRPVPPSPVSLRSRSPQAATPARHPWRRYGVPLSAKK